MHVTHSDRIIRDDDIKSVAVHEVFITYPILLTRSGMDVNVMTDKIHIDIII